MTNKFKKVTLPEMVVNSLNQLGLSSTTYSKAVNFLQILTHYLLRDYNNDSLYYTYSAGQFRTNYGGNYKAEFLNPLLKAAIVECDNKYSKTDGKALGYRLSPTLLDGSFDTITIKTKEEQYDQSGIISKLKIDLIAMHLIIHKHVKDQKVEDLKIIDIANVNTIFIKRPGSTPRYFSKEDLAWALEDSSQRIIKSKKGNYIAIPEQFIEQRKRNIRTSYHYVLNRLMLQNFSTSRNKRNGRLDSIFTSMPKVMLNKIKSDNDLTELDLKNSQFAILGNILLQDKEYAEFEDVKLFVELASKGILYEHISKHFEIPRDEAKLMMMEIAFSGRRSNDIKKQFQSLFPKVYEWVFNFKANSEEDSDFAVMLQKRESDIFIDNLLPQINKAGYEVITKHDSIIVRKEEMNAVLGIMKQYFASIDFMCTISREEAEQVIISKYA